MFRLAEGKCGGHIIINEMDVPVVAVGTRSLIIVVGFDGILVSDFEKSPYIKPYVEQLDAIIAER